MALLFMLLYITYCLGDYPQEAYVPPCSAPLSGQSRGTAEMLWQAGKQAGYWYLFPPSFMSCLSSLWWFTCRGWCVHHVQGNFLDLRCWYKYNCLCKKMVLIRLWIPKYCLLDIICLDIYPCLCVVLHIVMLECGIFYQPQNMLYIQFVSESRLIYLYILYLSYSLLAIIICCVELFAKLSWLPFAWVLFLGLGGSHPPSSSSWIR